MRFTVRSDLIDYSPVREIVGVGADLKYRFNQNDANDFYLSHDAILLKEAHSA